MKKENNLWIVIGVALVVAVVASLATVSLTGDVIKQNNNVFGKYEVYTKQETDAKFRSIDMKFSDSNNVAVAINKRIYTVAVEDSYTNSLVARCKDLDDIPLSGYCKTAKNSVIANHGTLIYKDSVNRGGFACSNVGSLKSDMKTTVYCIDLE